MQFFKRVLKSWAGLRGGDVCGLSSALFSWPLALDLQSEALL